MFYYYTKPKVIPNFLTLKEIEYIKENTSGRFLKSGVTANVGTAHYDTCKRVSESAWINREDHVVKCISSRCEPFISKIPLNVEDLQVVRYKPGGFFKPHQDCVNEECTRRYTFIMALNDDYEGGETDFPELGMKYKLNKGDALFFHLKDNHGLPTSSALHGGLPVKSGEKLICNLWVHTS